MEYLPGFGGPEEPLFLVSRLLPAIPSTYVIRFFLSLIFFPTFTQFKYLRPINDFVEGKHPTIWKDHRYAASLQALKESNWSKPVPPGHQAECRVSHKIAIIPSVVFMHVFRTEMILEKMWFRSTLWVKDFKLICFYMQPRFEIWTTVPVEPANLPYHCKLSEWWCLFHYADLAKNFWLWPSSRH